MEGERDGLLAKWVRDFNVDVYPVAWRLPQINMQT